MAALADRLREDLHRSRNAQHKALTLLLGTVLSDIEYPRLLIKRGEIAAVDPSLRTAREELGPAA